MQIPSIVLTHLILVTYCHSLPFINLTSSLNTEYAYPEQTVIFTCTVINSPILAWSSPNFIGENGIQLEFLSIFEPGIRMNSSIDPNTFAMLNSVTSGEQMVMESTLQVVASIRFQISSVACHNVGQGTENSVTFKVFALPAQEINSSGLSACPGDRLTFTCETRDSPILAWKSDQYIGINGVQIEFLFVSHLGRGFSNPSTVAELTNTSNDNGTLIIISQLNITVLPSIIQQDHSIACCNVGIGTERSITFQLADDCFKKIIPSDNQTNATSVNVNNTDFPLSEISKADTIAFHNGLLPILTTIIVSLKMFPEFIIV